MKTKFISLLTVGVAVVATVIAISCSKENASVNSQLKACGTCNWYGSNTPVCCNTSSGWGWENSASCISRATCTGSGQSCSGCSSSSSSSSSSSGGCGTCGSYPYCCQSQTGDWGWENSKSCITKGSGAAQSQCGGGSSSSSSSSSSSGSGGSGSCPSSLSCPSGISCGCYIVSGLGTQKSAMCNREVYWAASAMMETESMTTNYTYGDGKSGDAFNAGRCKQNYGAARASGVGQGSTGALWNYCTNLSQDYTVWSAIKSHYGSNYWSAHRGGSDWPKFKSANDWTYNQVNGHRTDNTRFWCSIPSI